MFAEIGFMPTVQDLLGIAQILQEIGVIDEKSRRNLDFIHPLI